MSRQHILEQALAVAQEKGYRSMTKEDVAAAAWCSPSLVSYHLGSIEEIRKAVMHAAVMTGCPPVVAQGLAIRDPIAMAASDKVKRAAGVWLCS